MIIGERPGLSSADSLGIYVTYAPQSGTPDSRRNCISNIRDGGLSIDSAADGVVALVMDMLRTGVSGVGLPDAVAALSGATTHGNQIVLQAVVDDTYKA
jgi:ethanolamine ammonia-lyase small subunit